MHRISPKLLLLFPLVLGACHHTRHTPALTEPAAQEPAPEQKGVLSRTADSAWNVVSAPARLVVRARKPAPGPPPVYEAPEAVIMTPDTINDAAPATRPQ